MSNTIPITNPNVLRDQQYLISYMLATAATFEQNHEPDEVTMATYGIDIANNHLLNSRAIKFGADHGTLDEMIRMSADGYTEPYVEGARFTLHGYSVPISTHVELEEHHPLTPLAEVPFLVTPSDCEQPIATVSLEDLLCTLQDLVQINRFNLPQLLDPREVETTNLADVMRTVLESTAASAKRTESRRQFGTIDPIIFDTETPIAELATNLGVSRVNGKITRYTLYLGTKQHLAEGSIDCGVRLLYDPRNGSTLIRNVRGQKHTLNPELLIESTEQSDPKDIIHQLTDGLIKLRAAKGLV